MTDKDANVRLVLLGDAAPAPVCEGDVCYLPDSTMDSTAPAADERTGDADEDPDGRPPGGGAGMATYRQW